MSKLPLKSGHHDHRCCKCRNGRGWSGSPGIPGTPGINGVPGTPGTAGTPGTGAVSSFSSGTPTTLSSAAGGELLNAVAIGNGISSAVLAFDGSGNLDLTPLLAPGVVFPIQTVSQARMVGAVEFTAETLSGIVTETVTVNGQLFVNVASTTDNVFAPVGTPVPLSPTLPSGAVTLGTVLRGNVSQGIVLNPGDRYLVVGYISSPSVAQSITFYLQADISSI